MDQEQLSRSEDEDQPFPDAAFLEPAVRLGCELEDPDAHLTAARLGIGRSMVYITSGPPNLGTATVRMRIRLWGRDTTVRTPEVTSVG